MGSSLVYGNDLLNHPSQILHRLSHLSAVGRLIPNSRHSSDLLLPGSNARITKRHLSSTAVVTLQDIVPPPFTRKLNENLTHLLCK